MLPFDRFVRAVDEWAGANCNEQVLIQIGDGSYEPRHARFVRIMPMTEYRDHLAKCDLFVAHVGMGSILQALQQRKQMLLLPRLHALGEHTTNHQLHTAARFADRPGLVIADTVDTLKAEMTRLLHAPIAVENGVGDAASPELLAGVRGFLNSALRTS